MSSSKPLMYAELLSNIRQISVIVSLDEPCDAATKVELSADGRHFILHHGGMAYSLSLPGQVPFKFLLPSPSRDAKELTWRLPLAGQPSRADMESAQNNDSPWPARYLGEEMDFCCRECSAVIIEKGRVKGWRDLPSENWAEMMDFWHCHRPDVPQADGASGHDLDGSIDESSVNRGYGANTIFAPTRGLSFVDLTTFLLAELDCTNIEVDSDLAPRHQTESLLNQLAKPRKISCRVCHRYIGYTDPQASGYRLYKWRLSTQPSLPLMATSSPSLKSPSLPTIISANLAATMQSQGVSRFVVSPMQWMPSSQVSFKPPHGQPQSENGSPKAPLTSSSTSSCASGLSMSVDSVEKDGSVVQSSSSSHSSFLSLWILTAQLCFSSNSTPLNSTSSSPTSSRLHNPKSMPSTISYSREISPELSNGTPVMKVFWKVVAEEAAKTLMDSNGVEEILLPSEAIDEIKDCLRTSSYLLPPSARKFQEWDVGLLERCEG